MGTEPTLRLLPSSDKPLQLEWDGRLVHSRNPHLEAQRHARALLSTDPRLVFCFGPGLAYLVEALLTDSDTTVVWVEERPEVLQAALRRLTPRLAALELSETPPSPTRRTWQTEGHPRLFLYSVTPGLSELRQMFGQTLDSRAVSTLRPTLQPSYLALIQQLDDLAFRESVNRNTLHRFDRLWVKNAYCNFAHADRFRPVKDLFGACKGIPAVVASAGPSLDRLLPILRPFRDRFILLAVDTALGPLSHAGIDPDFALSVDAQPANFFHARAYRGRARWIVDPTVSYLLLRHLDEMQTPAPEVFVFENPLPLVAGLLDAVGPRSPGSIHSGGSVSTNAYDLAQKMGCTPVYLCGLDLSFPGLRIHARGSALEEALHARTSRLHTPEHHNYSQLTAIDRRFLPDCAGNPVPTNDKLRVFADWYQAQFRNGTQGQGVKNVYGGGVCFSHVDSIDADSFARHLKETPPDQARRCRTPPNPEGRSTGPVAHDAEFRLQKLRDRFAQVLHILMELDRSCQENGERQDSEHHHSRLNSVAAHLLNNYPDAIRMLSNGMQQTLHSHLMDHARAETDEARKLARFYSELREACLYHMEMLDR